MRSRALLAILLALAATSCSTEQRGGFEGRGSPLGQDADVRLAAAYEGDGFSIKPPADWRTDESGSLGAVVAFFGPEAGGFTANINITAEDVGGIDLQAYVRASKQQLERLLTDYVELEARATVAGGAPAYLLGGTFTQGQFELRNRQLIQLGGGRAYVVTATATQETWAALEAEFDASLSSFRLT